MSFQPWFAILICILVSLSGCMKAAEKKITVPVPETKETKATVEQQVPYDPDIPKEYHHLLQGAKADDWRIPHLFLALADRHMAEGQEGRAILLFGQGGEGLCRKERFLRRGAGLL